jgi:hypothetical protein
LDFKRFLRLCLFIFRRRFFLRFPMIRFLQQTCDSPTGVSSENLPQKALGRTQDRGPTPVHAPATVE